MEGTVMTSREQFETWARSLSAGTGEPVWNSPAGLWAWSAWQASRAQALEDAALVCSQHNHAWIAADAIREMKE